MAVLLDGKEIARTLKEELKIKIASLQQKGIYPKLAVILVGNDPASGYYAQAKKKVCNTLGMEYDLISLAEETEEDEVLRIIGELNMDAGTHGIMIELPLPGHLNKDKILQAILPEKDVDGVHPVNKGMIMSGGKGLFPATPQSCIEILKRSGVEFEGKHVVLVGRGETVGKPLSLMILKHNATVTICHSKTKDLAYFTKQADIVIAAVGKARMITADMIKQGTIVVDAGINETENGMCGDVDFDSVKDIASMISPVPGGVGSLTTTLLLNNVLESIKLQEGRK